MTSVQKNLGSLLLVALVMVAAGLWVFTSKNQSDAQVPLASKVVSADSKQDNQVTEPQELAVDNQRSDPVTSDLQKTSSALHARHQLPKFSRRIIGLDKLEPAHISSVLAKRYRHFFEQSSQNKHLALMAHEMELDRGVVQRFTFLVERSQLLEIRRDASPLDADTNEREAKRLELMTRETQIQKKLVVDALAKKIGAIEASLYIDQKTKLEKDAEFPVKTQNQS